MNFLIGKRLAQTKTYLSCLNAAVLESVQRGAAIALNISKETGGNPASLKWAKFFVLYGRGQLEDRNVSCTCYGGLERMFDVDTNEHTEYVVP